MQKQPQHIRLPQRSALVRGRTGKAGQIVEKPDSRTATQDPNIEQEKRDAALPAAAPTTATAAAGKPAAA
jgi:hypothetical protein